MATENKTKFPTATLPPLSDTTKEAFENKIIQDWIAESTQSQETTQMLSHFGLKNPQDLTTFLRSPAGKTIRTLISQKIEAMNARKNNVAENQFNKQKLLMLFLGLAYKQEAAADAAEARITRHNNKLVQKQLDAGEKRIEEREKALEELSKSFTEAEGFYDDSIEAIQMILEEQNETLSSLENELIDIENSEREQEASADLIDTLMTDSDNFIGLETEEQQKLTHSDRELMLRFPKEKIIEREEGKSFLLERGQKLNQLSSKEKEIARQEYLKLKPELNAVQEKIKTSHQKDKHQLAERKARFIDKSSQTHHGITFLTQQLAKLQAAQHVVQDKLETYRLKPETKPTMQQKKQPNIPLQTIKTSPLPDPKTNTAVLTRSFKLMLQLDPRGTIAAQDRLGAPRLLQQTEFGMPIEDQTMRSLQKHRAGRAGALANAIARSAVAESSQRAHERLHPDLEPRMEAQPKTEQKVDQKNDIQPDPKPDPKPETPSPFSTTPRPQ